MRSLKLAALRCMAHWMCRDPEMTQRPWGCHWAVWGRAPLGHKKHYRDTSSRGSKLRPRGVACHGQTGGKAPKWLCSVWPPPPYRPLCIPSYFAFQTPQAKGGEMLPDRDPFAGCQRSTCALAHAFCRVAPSPSTPSMEAHHWGRVLCT
jgi:hypothetical protein